jgi:hypothetical protein
VRGLRPRGPRPSPLPLPTGEREKNFAWIFCEPRNVETSETKKAAAKTRRPAGRGHLRPRPRRPRHRQQSDAPRTLSTPDRRHARPRRPRRRAEAKHPHRPELPLLRGRRDEFYGEVEAVRVRAVRITASLRERHFREFWRD